MQQDFKERLLVYTPFPVEPILKELKTAYRFISVHSARHLFIENADLIMLKNQLSFLY